MIYLLWSGILFSTGVRTVVAAKLVLLRIWFLTSFILALIAAVVAEFTNLATTAVLNTKINEVTTRCFVNLIYFRNKSSITN